jgi:hypothetical protein
MMLWDRCEIWTYRVSQSDPSSLVAADVPCQISALNTAMFNRDDAPWAVQSTTRAMFPADLGVALKQGEHEIRHRGEVWWIEGKPEFRRKHGRDHHQTVQLTRTDFSGG